MLTNLRDAFRSQSRSPNSTIPYVRYSFLLAIVTLSLRRAEMARDNLFSQLAEELSLLTEIFLCRQLVRHVYVNICLHRLQQVGLLYFLKS